MQPTLAHVIQASPNAKENQFKEHRHPGLITNADDCLYYDKINNVLKTMFAATANFRSGATVSSRLLSTRCTDAVLR